MKPLVYGFIGFQLVVAPRSITLLYTADAIPMEMKLSIEKIPMPTPACSFVNVLEIEFAIEICIKDCPTLPRIKKSAMPTTEVLVKVESKPKQLISKLEATKYSKAFPRLSASFPPTRPSNAEAMAAGTITKPIQLVDSCCT